MRNLVDGLDNYLVIACLEDIFNKMSQDREFKEINKKIGITTDLYNIFIRLLNEETISEGFEVIRIVSEAEKVKDQLYQSFLTKINLVQGSFLTLDAKSELNEYLGEELKGDNIILKSDMKLVVSKCYGSFVKLKIANSKKSPVTEKFYHILRFLKSNNSMTPTATTKDEDLSAHEFTETKRPEFDYVEGQSLIRVFDLDRWYIEKLNDDNSTAMFRKNGIDTSIKYTLDQFRPSLQEIVLNRIGLEPFKIGDLIRLDESKIRGFMAFNNWYLIDSIDKTKAYDYWKGILKSFIGRVVDFTPVKSGFLHERDLIINFHSTPNTRNLKIEDFNFRVSIFDTIRVSQKSFDLYNRICLNSYRGSAVKAPIERIAMNALIGNIIGHGYSGEEYEYSYGNFDSYYAEKAAEEKKKAAEDKERERVKSEEDLAGGPYSLDHLVDKIIRFKKSDKYALVTSIDNVTGRIHTKAYEGKISKSYYLRASAGILDEIDIVSGLVYSDEEVKC